MFEHHTSSTSPRRRREDKKRDPFKNPYLVRRAEQKARSVLRRLHMRAKNELHRDPTPPRVEPPTSTTRVPPRRCPPDEVGEEGDYWEVLEKPRVSWWQFWKRF